VKCVVFFGGINLDGNNDKGGGGFVLFCLVYDLLGFACSNDYLVGTLFFVPCLFAANLGKLQNTNVKKKNANTCHCKCQLAAKK
jgi:hypothetical protein